MKKLASLLLIATFLLSAMSFTIAEEFSSFDPCANLWYWDHSDYYYEYADGSTHERHTNYRMPCHSYVSFEFKADGTYVQTSTTSLGEIYTYDGTWEKTSDTQLQYYTTVGEELKTVVLNYENGTLVEYSEGSLEGENIENPYSYHGVLVMSDDADGAIRDAMVKYQIDDNMDMNADESILKRDLEIYAYLDYSWVYMLGMDSPNLTMMRAEGNGWTGSVKWIDDETVYFSLNSDGEFLDVIGETVPVMTSMDDGVPAYMMEVTDDSTGTYYTIFLYKHADKDLYRLQFLSSLGIPVIFQAIPSELYE